MERKRGTAASRRKSKARTASRSPPSPELSKLSILYDFKLKLGAFGEEIIENRCDGREGKENGGKGGEEGEEGKTGMRTVTKKERKNAGGKEKKWNIWSARGPNL